MTLAELNALEQAAFVDAVGWVFEHSPWVAQRAWKRRPFFSLAILHEAMTIVVTEADRDEQLALLRAHPDLGTRLLSRGDRSGGPSSSGDRSSGDRSGGPSGPPMTAASTQEQSGAGLDRLAPGELDRLDRLNTAYRDKFGFPFLLAVKGSTPVQIVDALERRLPRSGDEELLEALRQVARIAKFRLEGLINP